ncbi:MAG: methyltransferase domain-containing protein [Hyphomonadaceae bacterium]|nr:methyltransferase domain-containing protein [Hyphomonadaceae bacterium]
MSALVQTDPIAVQQRFWSDWNTTTREKTLNRISLDQRKFVLDWLKRQGRTDLKMIEVGCGAGWLCSDLTPFGALTATDFCAEVLERAQARLPQVNFVAGDFMELDFGEAQYDVVICLEVLAHVADQPAFMARLARLLRPGGVLMLATQNAPVLQRWNKVPPPKPGNLRTWVDRHQLRALLEPQFEVDEISSLTPLANQGIMRLVNSEKLNRPIRLLFGDALERLKERAWLGWTLMTLARKPA